MRSRRHITFSDFSNPGHSGSSFKLQFESFKYSFIGFRVNFNLTRMKISRITGDPEPFGSFKREVAIPDALHTPANKIMFRANHNFSLTLAGRTYGAYMFEDCEVRS